ncbi:MAG: peptidoglycan DD-metalloendopeptidase family protein [Lachnospiraceae bacterium]|nr:peptidoglycan DD-metalloendopeptidase family protein [Lachnospiraceae bacterium]
MTGLFRKTKYGIIFVLCLFLCMAQFSFLPGTVAYADEDENDDGNEEDSGDNKEEDKNEENNSGTSGSSSEIEDIKRQIEESKEAKEKANETKQQLASGMADVQQVIGSLETEKNNVVTYVATLDAAMEQIQDDLDAINVSISENEVQIEDARRAIEKAEAALDEAERVRQEEYENIKDQVKFMYLAGRSTFLEILVTAESVSDLLNRTHYISKIMDYDREKLNEYAEAVREADEARQFLEENKAILEEKQAALEEKQAEAEGKRDDMSTLISAKEAEIGQYNAEIGSKEEQIKEYEQMIAQQDAEIAAIEQAIKQQQAALAEASRRVYGGGKFVWPAPGYTRISDDFGMRIHPTLGVQMMHNGIDMAAPTGSPILAAADGTVIAASYSGTMGNYIMIDHGSDIITVYMHASSLGVSAGQEVSAGDRIGSVGSTGRSTGPHLHFGVRKDGSYVNPWSYLK